MPRRTAEERFLATLFITETGCWERRRGLTGGGYTFFQSEGERMYSHRWSYTHFIGPIPPGAVVCHSCDNRSCVNPAHLFIGSQQDNMQDASRKGRLPLGEDRTSHKLTQTQVDEIRNRYADGETQRDLANEYGVTKTTVQRIVTGQRWTSS